MIGVAFPACGTSDVIPITPKNPDGGEFVFAVTTRIASNGLSFRVTVTAKKGTVPQDYSEAHLGLFKVTRTVTGTEGSISYLKPETRVALKRGRRVWKAGFVASNQLLSNPDTCFVFTVWDYRRYDASFYVLKLRDFTKQ